MAIYLESGLQLDLPDGHHFRFADIPTYKSLSGQNLKEMDFAWLANGHLFLLEVRSYTQLTSTLVGSDFIPVKGQAEPFRYKTLIDKVTDSLLMLLAAWAGSNKGQLIRNQLPVAAQLKLPLKLVIAVELPLQLSIHLQALRDSLNERLRGRMALADVSSVTLLDYTRLVSNPMFSPFIQKYP